MKKLIVVLLSVLMIFPFCSCKKSEKSHMLAPFEAHVEAECGKTLLTGKFRYVSPTCMSFTIEKPENLKNLTFGTQDGSDFVSIGSMNMISVPNDLFGAENNVLENLFEAVGSYKNGFTAKDSKTAAVRSDYVYGKCLMTFDTEEEKIVMLDAGKTKYIFTSVGS